MSQEECQSKEEQGEGKGEGEENIYSIPSTSTTQQGIPLPFDSSVSIWHFVHNIFDGSTLFIGDYAKGSQLWTKWTRNLTGAA